MRCTLSCLCVCVCMCCRGGDETEAPPPRPPCKHTEVSTHTLGRRSSRSHSHLRALGVENCVDDVVRSIALASGDDGVSGGDDETTTQRRQRECVHQHGRRDRTDGDRCVNSGDYSARRESDSDCFLFRCACAPRRRVHERNGGFWIVCGVLGVCVC